ncbi:transposase [Escherichia albertii]|uniref:transposase n=1 Tax=Escherichia albertii TaxID=208962 RepID=UPI0023624A5C|nr:transposase [Escherichia albertii]WDB72455.1 transposase [Escherichia albertii]
MAIRDEYEMIVGGRVVDSYGDWAPGIEHPLHILQRKEHDARIALEQEIRMALKEITFVSPEPQEMPDLCKSEALFELEKRYYPILKQQRIKLDSAYDKLSQMKNAIEPSEFEIQDELTQKPYVYFEYSDNDGFGIYPENIPDVINNLPDGYRIVKMVKASRGAGQFIYMTDKSDEELYEIAKQNILASRNQQIDNAKLYLSRELQTMKELISEYEVQKKISLQGDIEPLLKVPQKYSKAL